MAQASSLIGTRKEALHFSGEAVENLKEYIPGNEENLLNQVDLLVQALIQNGNLYESDADYQKAFDSMFTA